MLSKMEIKDAYWWEIKLLYEGGATVDDLTELLYQVYRGGYNDGLVEAKDRDYAD